MAFRTETENKERFITESSTHFQITLRVLSHSYRFEGEQQWEHRKVSSPVNFDYARRRCKFIHRRRWDYKITEKYAHEVDAHGAQLETHTC